MNINQKRLQKRLDVLSEVGSIKVFPDSRNSIPEEVQFSIDLRDIDVNRRNQCEQQLLDVIQEVAKNNHLTYEVIEDSRSDPSYCAEWIKEIMREEGGKMNIDPPELMSGAFHDALVLSKVCDYGMIFVRCKDGISHHPKEFASIEDIALGTELLYQTALKIIQK
jgi:allantoate deiminase